MTYTFKLSRRIARIRAPMVAAILLSITACNSTDSVNPDLNTPIDAADPAPETGTPSVVVVEPEVAGAYAGGIPIGLFSLPNSEYGSRYDGATRNIWPQYLLSNLSAIKARGGKIVLDFIGNQKNVRDAAGHFSLTKWKARIDQYRNINFSSYINDGTIVGHYLLDEPNDKTNWSGVPVSPSTVEEMARYSKRYWPGMATIVRANPSYMAKYTGSFAYLDGAWAQYEAWKGSLPDYLNREVSAARAKGLSLIVGLNVLRGGYNGSRMTATQVKSWGSTMLSSSYPCAFMSWVYNYDYLSTSAMKDAMDALRYTAKNRSFKSCRGS